jgi:hypothetical protein
MLVEAFMPNAFACGLRLTQPPLQRNRYVCVSTVISVFTELAMKHCSCAA